jgi:hypothetical protein
MFPDWLTKPEVILAIVLYLTAPAWVWLVGRAISWYAQRSELAAQANLEYLRRKIEHPPTLVESLAFIICLLPIPFTMAMVWPVLYFSPPPPAWFPKVQDPHTVHEGIEVVRTVFFLVFFFTYTLFRRAHGSRNLRRIPAQEWRSKLRGELQSRNPKTNQQTEEEIPSIEVNTGLGCIRGFYAGCVCRGFWKKPPKSHRVNLQNDETPLAISFRTLPSKFALYSTVMGWSIKSIVLRHVCPIER